MEQMFNHLKESKQNTVDNITKLIKDANFVDKSKATDEEIKKRFADVSDKSNVEFSKFKSVVEGLAKENKVNMDEASKKITDIGSKFTAAVSNAAKAGAKAFKGALGIK